MVGTPKAAQLIHYASDFEGGKIMKYHINTVEDFFETNFKQKPKHLKPVDTLNDVSFHDITVADFSFLNNPSEKDYTSEISGLTEKMPLFDLSFEATINQRIAYPTQQIFSDYSQQISYIKNGFTEIRNAIPQDIIIRLRELYLREYTTQPGMFVTHTTNDFNKNLEVSNAIFQEIRGIAEKYFSNTKTVISHFAVKQAGGENVFDLHQDWSIIDEAKYAIAHLWIPLVDTDSENGTLCFVPGSHIAFESYRSGSCGINFLPLDSLNEKVMSPSLKTGDILVYHPAIFHGSSSNKASSDRIAVIAAVAHQDAQLLYYHQTNDDIEVYKLEQTDVFGRLPQLAKGALPGGEKLYTFTNKKSERDNTALIKSLESIHLP